MVAFYDSYAKTMEEYGFQRGVYGSEARHTTTAQYYRDVQREKAICETEVQQLKEEQKETEEQLRQVKKEIKTDRLKAVTTQAKTNIVESVGSLFGSNKFKALEQENKGLYEEVAARDESIENLQTNIQRMQVQHNKQLLEIQEKHIAVQNTQQKEISALKKWLDKAYKWFPLFADAMRIEKLCRLVGFTSEQTEQLLTLKPLEYSGTLYSEEHKRNFNVTRISARIVIEPTDKRKFALHIDGKGVSEWLREQFEKLRQAVRQPLQTQKKGKGFKL